MCTAVTYKTKDFYFGRNLDYEFSYGDEVAITPRNFRLSFREEGKIKLCILSNTNKKEKAKKMSEVLKAEYYIYFAKKPLKFGFNKAKKKLNLENENIAVVGDQMLTDVLGANRSKMYSILVKPLEEKDIFITRFNRMIEKRILERYLKNRS